MKKVRFFQSIHLKFVLIYVLLILIAMQIIGVYFVRQLEKELVNNFTNSLTERVGLLAYNIEQELEKTRNDTSPTLEEDLEVVLRDFASMQGISSKDILEVRVIDPNRRIIGTSNPNPEQIVGKKINDLAVTNALLAGTSSNKVYRKSGDRIRVLTVPIRLQDDVGGNASTNPNNRESLQSEQEILGAVYLIATMEPVYEQMRKINSIFASGTVISLVITALLGVFLAQTITRPMSEMRKQALEMAKGNFSRKAKVYGYDEIGQLALTFNNLTRKLQEAQATTEGERRKLSSVLAHMTDGVIATDRKGRVILINDPAASMLNVSRETVLSEPIVTLLGLDETHTFESLLANQDSLILDFSTKTEPFILRATVSAIQKETGFINGIIIVLHDITEQEKIDQDRREFVANVSHELRTPLTTMRSYLDALAEGAWQDKEIAPSFLHVTQTETERMIRLVNDLLQLSKLDSEDYRFSRDPVNFVKFYHYIIDRFEMTIEQGITFVRELPDEAIYVAVDQDKITQVLDNIISNAIKYSPEGGTITFSIEQHTHEIVVSIKDQGMGIPKSNLSKIFERFYRVDKARTRKLGGTGLGLAIAKEIIEAHDGRIWAESKEGVGTSIYFTLPIESENDEEWE
ncbi:cell wall metabolism sensor histidine kinase WalK [Priestia flexa]|jgi:two-component system, OmpR family, sensor histidine kinase VicK|uniref:histidine kinase n=2 Tax=Priestia TaxID=2800373 RepID=A0A0V8JLZ5_9BACI|nr:MULTISPECIES: cell wall metabolism sensor histidine kinase WalK [Bacillaceae]AQX53028.1 PAS domain-containing sensor histidine kinase [Priestia flexa]KSU87978.1 PAS domain-containing sensor histidine kinase [Priestia veravalensis]KZB92446.1 PAS domain-containing sensor histidine kinase [Bacillus sp. VT 712]MBN8253451.1 cell wall metabolism sensor histidine kinase WalK [Priestia flexa]MBN8433454.1 cell wall metabolism sensor histidine kinase WalK [Priestia flexa]